MSGHSKWSRIKRQKGATDQKRGRVFSKLSKTITLAAREKGSDPDTNFTLRLAMERAKIANMPLINVERAINKGTGEIEGKKMEEVFYEIYGPGGVAIIVKAITDNKNRTVSDIKNILSKSGGRLGETNSVRWLFEEKGTIRITAEKEKREELILNAIEIGAEDVAEDDEGVSIITEKENLQKIKEGLEKKYPIDCAEIETLPKNPLEVNDPKKIKRIENLLEKLEDYEDTTDIFSNLKE